MTFFRSPILFICICVLPFNIYATQINLADHYETGKTPYQQGLERIKTGDIETALDYWFHLSRNNQDTHNTDPRIGVAYLEVVTEHQMFDYYQKANDVYFWAFQTNQLTKYEDVLKEEVERLRPLLEHEEYRDLRKAINNNDHQTCHNKLKRFWILADPTPDSEYNERLLEHWERIFYVKHTFTRAKNTVYNADDRAITYI
ncbi:MAG TPA: GWxTD domain-containing protein [Balneolaceae bacterium]|nr:GWxTD domain-containing protein [Balneolaceae bacterium]